MDSILRDLQCCELEMLKSFIQVCERLELRYYIVGGTLLGAVRHKGFIPWDDDIDIAMPREDYERFVKHGQAYLPEYYFLQDQHTDPEWPANFAKIRDSRTTFIETSVKKQKINHGAFIDIFPLDYYPTKPVSRMLFKVRNRIMVKRISAIFTPVQEDKGFIRAARDLSFSAVARVMYPTVKRALEAREKLFAKCPRSGLLANHCGAWGAKEIMPAEWFGDGAKLEFEGITVKVPTGYERYLTHVYGDYMQLPPEEKRITHHFTEVIDLKKPYSEYINRETEKSNA